MCTFSFVPTKRGYYAAMNRDERLTRSSALPPELFHFGKVRSVYPHEQDGGTWFAVNDHGITLALLNWNLDQVAQTEKQRSRGSLIPQLIGQVKLQDVVQSLRALTFEGILPFRLAGIFHEQKEIHEWRWNGSSLSSIAFPWETRHWFSSGLSDELAERERGEACRIAWQDPEAGDLNWLRALHRSHGSLPGPFSLCAHRPDAGTVSYSEVAYDPTGLKFTYIDGMPCRNSPALTLDVPLARPQAFVAS